MIKFFRSIRQESLAQNKVLRYLLYAIGEIVLVVIGILIALAVTDWNDKRKKEQKIELIFEDILLNLSADITATTGLMQDYEEKDTLINLVLNGNLTFEDYDTYKMPGLWNLTSSGNEANLIQNGYNNLIQDLDAIPVKYKSITQELNNLYGRRKHYLVSFNTVMREMIDNNIEIEVRNYPWYGWYYSPHPDTLLNNLMIKKNIQYYLTDFKYRNEVMNYRINGLENHLRFAVKYRDEAIECYKKIATLLNKPIIDKSFE